VTITIVVPFINLTGGIRVLLDYANWLHDHGHQVTVTYPLWPYQFQYTRRQQWGEFRKHLRQGDAVPWFPLRCPVKAVPLVQWPFVPRADVVVAAGWAVAHDVARLPASAGRKVLIVFHHEDGTGPARQIEAIYSLPYYRIAFSEFVRHDITSRFGCTIHEVVPNGVDRGLFYPDGAAEARSVLFLYHPDPRKGPGDGLAALGRLREQEPGVTLRSVGPVRPGSFPDWLPFEFHPEDATLRKRYSQSTTLLYSSRHEGFGLPPLEAMSCGCPPITTAVGAVPEYASDGVNATIVPVGDIDAMVNGMLTVLRDPARRARLSQAGVVTAERYAIERVTPLFAAALTRAIRPS
jgi:glycosyltransferase involved in cell wall biosynthesis